MFIKQWPTFETVSLWVLTAVIVLAPILFLPIPGLAIDVGKTFILSLGIIAVLVLWLISLLQESRLSLPWVIGLAAPLPLLIGLFVSALFSGVIKHSLFGSGYEHGTVWFWLLLSLVFGLSALIFQSKERVIRVFLGLLAAGVVVFLFQVILTIFGPFNWLSLFTAKTVNLIGKWNELAIFFGLITIIAVSIWELVPPKGSKLISYLVGVSLVTSLIALAFINFYRVWLVVAILSLALFIYLVVIRERGDPAAGRRRRVTRPVFAVLVVAIIFLTIGQSNSLIGRGLNWVTANLEMNSLEVWPTESATWQVLKQTLLQDPLLGAGPNQFATRWQAFKPLGVNASPFWTVDFGSGSGYFPTFLVMAGTVGFLGWLALILSWGFSVIRGIFTSPTADKSGHSLAVVVFLAALYGWIFATLYVPGAALLVITMALSGIALGVLVAIKRTVPYELSLTRDPRINFISILVIIFALILSIGAGYLLIQKIASIYWYQQGLLMAQAGRPVSEVETYFLAATNWSNDEAYERALVDVGLAKIGLLLSTNESSPETLRTQFEGLLSSTVTAANEAIGYNRHNYANWLALARVYESLVPLKIPGAYDQAVNTYTEALRLNPTNPAIDLLLARLELAVQDRKQAREYLLKAIAKKPNYTDALFLLAQLDIEDGNLTEAITRAENAALLSPNDGGIFFQLGFLRYRAGDYAEAKQALGRAISLIPNYANAQYFLGLAEAALGNRQAAIAQFQIVATANPDNTEVKTILTNLRAGREPFASGVTTPDKRTTPPVKDN